MKHLRSLLAWIVLGIYWPVLFVSTHIPRPPHLQIYGRDVTLHFSAYMILTLLYWLARYGKIRPSLRQRKLYLTVLLIAGYGALDELSQGLVHRNCDIIDWFSDMSGCLAALAVLFLVRRWVYWLILYWVGMFVITHWPLMKPLIKLPTFCQQFEIVYTMLAYFILTLLWWRTMCPQSRFVINKKILLSTVLVIPLYALLDEFLSFVMRGVFDVADILSGLAGFILALACAASLARHHIVNDAYETRT